MKKTKKDNIFLYIITLKWFFLGLIIFYKKCLSPLLPKSCIYYPSCSSYMFIAIKRFGVFKGVFLGIKRLFRCVPWKEGGFDPVPDNPKGDMKWLM